MYSDTSPLSVPWQWPQIKAGRLADKVDRLVNRCAHLAANTFMAVTNMTKHSQQERQHETLISLFFNKISLGFG